MQLNPNKITLFLSTTYTFNDITYSKYILLYASFKNTIFRNSMGNLLKFEDENCVLLIIFKCSESFIAKTDLFYLNYR